MNVGVVVMADLNANVGNDVIERIVGRCGVTERNGNGE